MAIISDMTRVVLAGEAPGGEIFQWGFWCRGTASSAIEATALAQDVKDAWSDPDVIVPIASLLKSDSRYTSLKVYCYPTGGPSATYVGEANLPITDGNQGSGSGNAPLYQCMVVSTHTSLAGRRHRGRFYLPTNGTALNTSHRYDDATCNSVATAVKVFFDAINTFTVPENMRVTVLSQKFSEERLVTDIAVDSKPDVQRRRENRMAPGTTARRDLAA